VPTTFRWFLLPVLAVAGCTPQTTAPADDAAAPLSAAAMDSMLAGTTAADSVAPPTVNLSVDSVRASATLAAIGYQSGLLLNGAIDHATLTIPVNPGRSIERLLLDVMPTPRMPDATLILRQGERVLAQHLLTDTTTSVALSLAEAIVAEGRAVVSLGVNVPGRDACEAPLFYRTVLPPSGRIEYGGTPVTTGAISGFFPSLLSRVVFYLPDNPSLDAAQAALDAAAFVARRYRGMGTTFEVAALPSADSAIAEPGWRERAIVFVGNGPTRVLRPEGGRGTVLAVASRRDARQLFTLAQGPAMVPTSAFAATTVRLDDREVGNISLDQLGIGSRTIEGGAMAVAGYRFALADLGPGVSPRAFRLVARHSTIPEHADGEVAVLLNGDVIWSRPVDGAALDATINFPAHLVGRDNQLEVRFVLRLGEGECRLGAPLFTATIDGASAFITEARLTVPPSFDRFPATMLPTFSVLLAPRDRYRVELAADVIAAMQRTTTTPLAPFVLRDQAEVRGALLAVGTTPLADALDAPVASDGFRLRDIDGRVWDEYRPSESYAAIQAYERGGRDVLLLHHTGADGQPLADLLRETLEPYGWFGMHGDLALRGPDGPSTVLTAANAGWRMEPIEGERTSVLARWRSAIFIGTAILLLGLLIWLYPRVVRRELDPAG
jgi:hypothetical protein